MKDDDQEELRRAIAGMHSLLPGAQSFAIMAFLPDGEIAVFGDTDKKTIAAAYRRWSRDVLLGKKRTTTIVGDTTQMKQ